MHKAIKSVLDHGSRGLSRRSAIKAGGAALATGAIVAVGVNATKADTGDARLKALARELTQAEREYEQASALANAAHANLPDWVKEIPAVEVGLNSGGGGFIQHESNLNHLEESYRRQVEQAGGDDGIVEAIKNFIDGRRAEFQRHRARVDAHKRQCGYTALQESADRAIERCGEIEKQILDTPAETVAGVAIKLKIAVAHTPMPDARRDRDWGEQFLGVALEDAERLAGAV